MVAPMNGCTMRPIICSAISLFALTGVACFPGATPDATPKLRAGVRAIPVVPATEAPPPPEGTGWSCYEAAKPNRFCRMSLLTRRGACARLTLVLDRRTRAGTRPELVSASASRARKRSVRHLSPGHVCPGRASPTTTSAPRMSAFPDTLLKVPHRPSAPSTRSDTGRRSRCADASSW